MDISSKDRLTLKSYFRTNLVPTEKNFAELIDGMLNQKDDGIVKQPGDPLCIAAAGDAAGPQRLINFYGSLDDTNPAWMLQLNPGSDQNRPETARAGFSVSDGQGVSRLFIDKATGFVGIGTINPAHSLDVRALNINLSLQGSGGGQLRITNDQDDNKIYLEAFSQDGSGHAAELLLTGMNGRNVPRISLKADLTALTGNLQVIGNANISDGTGGVVVTQGYMASGSLTIGSLTASYGGGNVWNSNTAGLLLETQANTEIAVHDSGTRVASFMYYEGKGANRITIGRDMGWGPISSVVINGNVGIGTSNPTHKLHVVALDQVGLFESTGGNAYLRVSTNEGLDNRIELANRPGGRLSLVTAGAGDVLNITRDGKVGIGTLNPNHSLDVSAHRIKLGLESGGGGQLIITSNQDDNRIWLEAFNKDGNGHAAELLLTGMNGQNAPRISLKADLTSISGNVDVVGGIISRVHVNQGLGPEDGTDKGQIVSRVLSFTKRYADTAVRVVYTDNFRIMGDAVAARWEIRFDGAPPPGGAIYQDKYGSSGNFHEPAVIIGYAVGIAPGTHTIGVWVGQNPSYSVCDAYTGWGNSRWTLEAQEVWI